jgi:hypothetical protein
MATRNRTRWCDRCHQVLLQNGKSECGPCAAITKANLKWDRQVEKVHPGHYFNATYCYTCDRSLEAHFLEATR